MNGKTSKKLRKTARDLTVGQMNVALDNQTKRHKYHITLKNGKQQECFYDFEQRKLQSKCTRAVYQNLKTARDHEQVQLYRAGA